MSYNIVFEQCPITYGKSCVCLFTAILLWHQKQKKHSPMMKKEKVRCTADRFTNYDRAYIIYLIRRGQYYEELPIYARSLYQAVAHSVHLISYAFAKLGVIEVVILPCKASKSGLSVFRQRKGEDGVIKRLQDVTTHDVSVSDILSNWDVYKSINHFVG